MNRLLVLDDETSIRDEFARTALPVILRIYRYDTAQGIGMDSFPKNVAAHAYRIADAMMEARKERR